MIKLEPKPVIEFLFWIVLFVLAMNYFNKSRDTSLYLLIGSFLFVLLMIEIILIFKHLHKKDKKVKIKHIPIKYDKKNFYKELTFLCSFVVILITMFSLIIQKDKFIEFLSFKHPSLYIILAWFIVAWVITILEFIDYRKAKKQEESKIIVKMKYDFTFLFGLIVVVLAYIFQNWVTAILGLILMTVSLAAYNLTIKKDKIKEKTIEKPQKGQKIRLLLEHPVGVLTKVKEEEKKTKEEVRMERLKLRGLQKKIREEEKRKKKEEKLRRKHEKWFRLKETIEQKKIEMEKKRLEEIKKSKEKILVKEERLGKIQKNREEIEKMIEIKDNLRPKAKYETDFDRLLALINKYERLRLSDVAKIFEISIKQAEEWVTILEQHKLLEIHYPAVGEPELKIRK